MELQVVDNCFQLIAGSHSCATPIWTVGAPSVSDVEHELGLWNIFDGWGSNGSWEWMTTRWWKIDRLRTDDERGCHAILSPRSVILTTVLISSICSRNFYYVVEAEMVELSAVTKNYQSRPTSLYKAIARILELGEFFLRVCIASVIATKIY